MGATKTKVVGTNGQMDEMDEKWMKMDENGWKWHNKSSFKGWKDRERSMSFVVVFPLASVPPSRCFPKAWILQLEPQMSPLMGHGST